MRRAALDIADVVNNRIREVSASTAPVSFATAQVGSLGASLNVLYVINRSRLHRSYFCTAVAGRRRCSSLLAVSGAVWQYGISHYLGRSGLQRARDLCSRPPRTAPAGAHRADKPGHIPVLAGGHWSGTASCHRARRDHHRGGNGTQVTAGKRRGERRGVESPDGVAMDTAGNLYIADNYNKRIRKVGSKG